MFRIFRKAKQARECTVPVFIQRLIHTILRRQRLWALWLQEQSEKLSPTKKKLALLTFVIVWLIPCGYWLYAGFTRQSTGNIPTSTDKSFNMPLVQPRNDPDLELYKKLEQARRHLDTNTAAGKLMRKKLQEQRPGLLDTIETLQREYGIE